MTRDLRGGRKIPVIVLWIHFYFGHLWFLLTIGASDIQRIDWNVRIWLTGRLHLRLTHGYSSHVNLASWLFANVATVRGTNLFELFSPVAVSWWHYEGVSFATMKRRVLDERPVLSPSCCVVAPSGSLSPWLLERLSRARHDGFTQCEKCKGVAMGNIVSGWWFVFFHVLECHHPNWLLFLEGLGLAVYLGLILHTIFWSHGWC